jgi:hypothetical protein
MQQVAEWLEKLGLGQYAQRFAAIGFSVLSDLTDHVKEIAVIDASCCARPRRQPRCVNSSGATNERWCEAEVTALPAKSC